MTNQPVVVFVCTHNAGRSLAARVLLDHHARVASSSIRGFRAHQ